jgi:hypothetical protein
MNSRTCKVLAAALLAAGSGGVMAQDWSVSGYGTVGYARSNRDFNYLRWIDKNGTATADTVFGAQADLRLNSQWSATLQLKAAPSLKSDSRWDITPAWAFVAWRPTDDWLLRVGRMRVPLYLHSESMDLGVSHDLARLPAEMYSIVSLTDFNGVAVAKTWPLAGGELSADAYAGTIGATTRFWLRDGVAPQVAAGTSFLDIKVRTRGLVLTWRGQDSVWRAGLHHPRTSRANGEAIIDSYPYVQVAQGIGYYQVSDALPGPGLSTRPEVANTVFTLGADVPIAPAWRLTGEYARMRQKGSELGTDQTGGYVALMHSIGRFTPYVGYASLRSSDTVLGWYSKLTQTQLPASIPGAAQINAAMRAAGEMGYAADQHSWMLGMSYALDGRSKLKAEFMRTHIGLSSRLVDTPPGQETVHDTGMNVWSVNYSFSF